MDKVPTDFPTDLVTLRRRYWTGLTAGLALGFIAIYFLFQSYTCESFGCLGYGVMILFFAIPSALLLLLAINGFATSSKSNKLSKFRILFWVLLIIFAILTLQVFY